MSRGSLVVLLAGQGMTLLGYEFHVLGSSVYLPGIHSYEAGTD